MLVARTALTYLRYKFHVNLCRNLSNVNLNDVKTRDVNGFNEENSPGVSVSDIRRTLRLNSYSVEDGFACILTKCPICKTHAKTPSDKAQMYINKTTGYFLCPECDYSGQWSALEKLIKKPDTLSSLMGSNSIYKRNLKFMKIWEEIIQKTSPISAMTDEELATILDKLNLPFFPDANKILDGVRLSQDKNSLYFPLQDLSSRVVGYINHQEGLPDHTVPKEECGGIIWFKRNRAYSKEHSIIVVPTVIDALAVASQKISGGVICLPYGFNSIPQPVLPVLEKWSKLILWTGSESIRNVPAIARKLGESRCLLIRPTDVHPSASEALIRNLDFKSILSSAHPIWHKSITTFKNLRQDVLSDLHNVEKVQGIKWKRYPTLSKLLLGHRRGELTVLTGPTGCGKTTFCSEYSLDLALQGVNTLWGSFEIRNARLVKTMLQQLAGFPLEEQLDQFDKHADMFENLPLYFLMFHGQQSIKDVMEAVEHATYVHDIAHVIIDNVQFMLGVGDDAGKHSERFWRQDAVVGAFRTFATRSNCHVTLVMHPRKERDVDDLSANSIFGSAKASQEADNVLIIQDKRLTTIRGKKYLQIAKNRYSGDLGIMPLDFDKSSLSYAQKKTKLPNKETESPQ